MKKIVKILLNSIRDNMDAEEINNICKIADKLEKSIQISKSKNNINEIIDVAVTSKKDNSNQLCKYWLEYDKVDEILTNWNSANNNSFGYDCKNELIKEIKNVINNVNKTLLDLENNNTHYLKSVKEYLINSSLDLE